MTTRSNWLSGQVTRSLGHGRHTSDGRDWLWLWLSQGHDHPRFTSIRWGDVAEVAPVFAKYEENQHLVHKIVRGIG